MNLDHIKSKEITREILNRVKVVGELIQKLDLKMLN